MNEFRCQQSLSGRRQVRAIEAAIWDNESGPKRCANTSSGLTQHHSTTPRSTG